MKKLIYTLLAVSLIFSACEKEEELYEEDITYTNTPLSTDGKQTYVPDDNFEERLEALGMGNGIANDDYVALSNIVSVNTLAISNQGISDLTGIEDFVSLYSLSCSYNQLTSLDVSANTALTSLECGWSSLTSLDVSQNTALTSLGCGANPLTSLDVSQNTALTSLGCGSSQLTSLDVSQNTVLTTLYCSYNQLTSLDVSQNTALATLHCNNNQLTSLDVSQNTALTSLHCNNNQLTILDMRGVNYVYMKNIHALVNNLYVMRNDFSAYENPNLYCISVDNVAHSEEWWRDQVGLVFPDEALATDAHCSFSENCP
jgi:hypothetical protein